MKRLEATLFSLMTLLCLSFTGSLTMKEYFSYVEQPQHGLHIIKESGQTRFELQYKPLDYMLGYENAKQHFSPADLTERKQELQGYYYFTFRVGSTNNKSLLENKDNSQEHFDKLTYAEFSMQKDFKLIAGKDTVPCEVYQFERNYNLVPFNNFVLGFPIKDSKKQSDFHLVYKDNLFGQGEIDFTIKAKDLKNIPVIKNL